MLDVGQLLEIVTGFGWQYTLTGRDDGDYLCIIKRGVGQEHSFEFQATAKEPEAAVWLALRQAAG